MCSQSNMYTHTYIFICINMYYTYTHPTIGSPTKIGFRRCSRRAGSVGLVHQLGPLPCFFLFPRGGAPMGTIGKPWENHGKTMENHGKMVISPRTHGDFMGFIADL